MDNMQNNQQPRQGMKWHNFLIYFSLWAGGILNALSCIQYMCGSHYGTSADAAMIRSFVPSLWVVDICAALFFVVIGVFFIVVRYRLAAFRFNAPKALLIVMSLPTIVTLVHLLIVGAILSAPLNFSTLLPGIIGIVVMISLNKIYYDKRAHLFVN